ncbi:MAG: putative transrane anti-sigma factor, partial [Caulobacteraceae bacterium]|nr:putative transrane anti-sigma factor [Caulobacteraceae bacterium]
RTRPAWRERTAWGLGGGGLALAACIAGAVLILPGLQVRGLERELVASHVRSQLAGHLIDVATSNEHVVKPWFGGKLDYSPPVIDLAQKDFPIVGGRLDYLAGREVAAIVYARGAHVINLFVWPDAKAPGPAEAKLGDGYTLLHWAAGGMTYWAVSDVNPADLRDFTALLKAGSSG